MRIVMAAIVSIALAPAAAAQPGLDSVRELYASADYEGVLSALGQLSTDRLVQRDSRELTRYRVLCLVALERTVEAERAMEEMLMRDPLYSISAAEASPRVVDAFAAVRRRTLPTVARTLYQDGRAAYGRKAFAEAVERLETTIRLIDNPDGADDPDLADLKTLASGFLDLSRTALAQAAPPPLPATKLAATNASQPAPQPRSESRDPVVIRQDLPPWPGATAGRLFEAEFKGAVEVAIDEQGNVIDVQLVVPVHPVYDPALVAAARRWRYEPALKDGKPVGTRKRVEVTLRPK